MSDDQNQPFDLGSALARIGNIPTQDMETKLHQAAQDEGAAYRGRLAEEQPRAPETPSFGYGMVEPITQPKAQPQPSYDYSAANLESGRNLSRQSFVDSYNKQAAAEPWVDTLNAFASAISGRPVSPYNANPSNYRQLTPSEEAEKYRSEQSEYAGLAAGIATPELASATNLARFAPGPNQLNMFLPARAPQIAKAEELEQQSIHPDKILKQTGAFRDVDGRWMREISDASSRVTPEAQEFLKDYESAAGPAPSVFEHPELYKQAPGLKKHQIELEQEPEFITAEHPNYFPGFQHRAEFLEQQGYSPKDILKQSNMVRTPEGEWQQRHFPLGWYSGEEQNIKAAGATPEDFRKTILHESSHAVDKAMGRTPYGADDERIYQDLTKLPKEEVIARAQASRAAGSPWAPNFANYKDDWEGFLRQQASDEYMRNAAEARARNVETRRNMSEAERLNTHPFKTMDIPPEQQIVGYANTPGSKQLSVPQPTPTSRDVDALGYYSHALESAKALPQAKGTPEQMLAQLKKAGVKDAELQATGMPQFLEGKPSVTRDELVQHLEDNRVALNLSQRPDEKAQYLAELYRQRDALPWGTQERDSVVDRINQLASRRENVSGTKWSNYSLDPQNPTYRETVLHLPIERRMPFDDYAAAYRQRFPANSSVTDEQLRDFYNRGIEVPPTGRSDIANKPDVMFQSGHFSEPNITGHLMTSMVEDNAGRKVFNVDQIQSDWGQKLREGGVRDEAKIADLHNKYEEAYNEWKNVLEHPERYQDYSGKQGPYAQVPFGFDYPLNEEGERLRNAVNMARAEYQTSTVAAPGHPLVNTTDQWTNTTLRHALRQAVESGADAISIPSGKTVLSYNPGDPHGMQEFYGKIVPKNLGNILKKIDPSAAKPEFHDQMITPSRGARGQGFTVFPLTDKIKKSVMEEGQPLFKRGGRVLRADGGAISDGTRALLAKLKRQDGGPLYDPNPIPSHYSAPKGRLQPDDPNFGSFRALGAAFRYNAPPDARESTNVEDRRFTHPSLPTSDFGNYDFHTTNAFSRPKPVPPTSAAGIQGMSGTQSGPSPTRATLEPWSTNPLIDQVEGSDITPEPSWTPPPLKALMQSSMLRNFDSYAPQFGSGRAPIEPLMQPSLASGGSISHATRHLLAKLKNRT